MVIDLINPNLKVQDKSTLGLIELKIKGKDQVIHDLILDKIKVKYILLLLLISTPKLKGKDNLMEEATIGLAKLKVQDLMTTGMITPNLKYPLAEMTIKMIDQAETAMAITKVLKL